MEIGRFELCLNAKNLVDSKAFYESLGLRVTGGDATKGYLILQDGSLSFGLY